MADDHLDKYLENLGISMEEEEKPASPQSYGEPELERDQGEPDGKGYGSGDQEARGGLEHEAPAATDRASAQAEGEGDVVARCETFLVNLLLNIDPAYAPQVSRASSGELFVEIYGGDPGKIIGRGGRTLAALEYLTNTVVNQGEERAVRVNVDVGGYKRRRDDRLVNTARKAAARVRKTGFAVELEPMSAAERRVVHMELAENPYVYSESTGEGKDRRLVVKPR